MNRIALLLGTAAMAAAASLAACGPVPVSLSPPTTTATTRAATPPRTTTTLPPATTAPATPTTAPPTTMPPTTVPPTTVPAPGPRPEPGPATAGHPILQPGDSGPDVTDLQTSLASLGYWLGPADGTFGPLTEQAVLAVQKAAGLARDGVVGPATTRAVQDGVRPVPRGAGSGLEVDLEHQLVLVVSNGRLEAVLNASSGNGRPYTMNGVAYTAVTPTGHFSIFRRVDGWDPSPLGLLWRPAYFQGGTALHGYEDVPPYPASHGCVRVSIPAMDWLWSSGQANAGTGVWVY